MKQLLILYMFRSQIIKASLGLLAVILFVACAKDPQIINDPDDPEDPAEVHDFEIPFITPNGDEKYLIESSDYIFNDNVLHTFEIRIPEANLAFLDNDPAREEYTEAALIFEGDTISPIGMRYKGSVGAYVNCLSGTDIFNPSGSKTCTKLSIKLKINWLESNNKFFGLKKLQFHSMNLDQSQFHDRLGYHLFREMGVPAPRCVHAKLIINGKLVGLFALVEQIDGRFTKYNFENGDGNLYKEVWPLTSQGQVTSDQVFMNSLKTNEDENPDFNIIRSVGVNMKNAQESNLLDELSNWMDIEESLAYCAVDRTIRHDDGPFHWYCNGSNCNNHNYYLYEDPVEEKLHVIAWDLDNAFENIRTLSNPVTPVADGLGEVTNNCNPFGYGVWNLPQWSASCDPIFKAWSQDMELYEQKIQELKDGPLSQANVDAVLDKWYDQIQPTVEEASLIHTDAISVSEWGNAVSRLKSDLEYARAH